MSKTVNRIKHDGFTYAYQHKVARHKKDFCLATNNPGKYCNGYFLYSDKDPGSGKEFVIVETDNPKINIQP